MRWNDSRNTGRKKRRNNRIQTKKVNNTSRIHMMTNQTEIIDNTISNKQKKKEEELQPRTRSVIKRESGRGSGRDRG